MNDGFEKIPNDLLLDVTISLPARAVYAFLRHLIWKETGRNQGTLSGSLAPLGELAAEIGCSRTALKGYLQELRYAGWIATVRKTRDRPQRYIIYAARGSECDPPVGRNATHSSLQTSTDTTTSKDVVVAAPGRKRNLVFDALVEETHANPAQGGMIAKAAKDIRTAMADTLRELREGYMAQNPHEDEVPSDAIEELVASEIRRRADLYRRLRPEWELTPTALAKHWNRIPTWEPNAGMRPRDIAQLRDEDFGVAG